MRLNPEIDGPQPLHALDQQTRAHNQNERECDLGNHEAGPHALGRPVMIAEPRSAANSR